MSETNGHASNGHIPDPLAHLSAAHLADLRAAAGLADQTILEAGVQTVKDSGLTGCHLHWNC